MIKAQVLGDAVLQRQIKKLSKRFPEEVRRIVLEVALVDVETYAKEHAIPVDTGRLRASIHTKFRPDMVAGKTPDPETYLDGNGKQFDGRLSGMIDRDTVIVGTNVPYAIKINREGGGGKYSMRKSKGKKRPKGYGRGFFTKAVLNGRIALRRDIKRLIDRIGGLV